MAAERINGILQFAREGLTDPEVNPEQQKLLSGIVDSVRRYHSKQEISVRAAERRARIQAEVEAEGMRVGVPLAKFLAARGVTTETKILHLIPDRISAKDGTGLAGVPIERGAYVEGLELGAQDVGFAIKALNVLYAGASRLVPYDELAPFSYSSTLSEIRDVKHRPGSWVGAHTEAVLRTMLEHLPEFEVVPVEQFAEAPL